MDAEEHSKKCSLLVARIDERLGLWVAVGKADSHLPGVVHQRLLDAEESLTELRDKIKTGDLVGAHALHETQKNIHDCTPGLVILAMADGVRAAKAESHRVQARTEPDEDDQLCVLVQRSGLYAEPICFSGRRPTVQQLVKRFNMKHVTVIRVNGKRVPPGRLLRGGPIGDVNNDDWPGDVIELT